MACAALGLNAGCSIRKRWTAVIQKGDAHRIDLVLNQFEVDALAKRIQFDVGVNYAAAAVQNVYTRVVTTPLPCRRSRRSRRCTACAARTRGPEPWVFQFEILDQLDVRFRPCALRNRLIGLGDAVYFAFVIESLTDFVSVRAASARDYCDASFASRLIVPLMTNGIIEGARSFLWRAKYPRLGRTQKPTLR